MKKLLLIISIALIVFVIVDVTYHYDYIDAFSGATPIALDKTVPHGISLKIRGLVEKEHEFTTSTFKLLAKTRVRTREVSREGKMLGTFIYYGVPLFNLMEGIKPRKTGEHVFDKPLDILVTFTSRAGQKSCFSYGELTMTDDAVQPILAFHQQQLLPDKDPETYQKNCKKPPLRNLNLVCPGDFDTSRYLEDVVAMDFSILTQNNQLMPKMLRKKKIFSANITAVEKNQTREVELSNVNLIEFPRWFRTGHGRGLKSEKVENVKGLSLRNVLQNCFANLTPADYFIISGDDGYRCLFSYSEIFVSNIGQLMMIIQEIDGKAPREGLMLGSISDYYLDRSIRAVTHIQRVTQK